MLKLYNSLARETQEFQPIEPGRVRMYVCGMTVYDLCHLGHARVMVVFDMVARWLRASGYQVTYVRNITDIDDKIIRRAGENGETLRSLTDRYIAAMHEDAAALGVQRPDFEPRATEFVPQMLDLIGALQKNGYAYVAGNQDVCYSVRKFAGYGKLSGKSLEDLRAGERVDVAAGKQDPLDFVLWKHAKEGEPDEARWPSPWGAGRPGWHIECSAMGSQLLGDHFDIHGGGQDLQFPHHENEIAQSEGAHGGTFVNYWMHNGFVRVDDEKMSKSLGNFFTIRDVLKRYDPEVVRFFILRAHYRSPLNYSDAHLDDAKQALTRLYTALKEFDHVGGLVDWDNEFAIDFRQAMDDDFGTPSAVAVLFALASEVNRLLELRNNWAERTRTLSSAERDVLSGELSKLELLAALLRGLASILGLLERKASEFLQGRTACVANMEERVSLSVSLDELADYGPEAIDLLIEERLAAKKAKNFAEADRIRDELKAAGIVLEDGPGGTTWRRA